MTPRRGLALLVVLWALVLAAVIVASIQAASYSQAMGGREALARVRAYWAARAGVEATIAAIEEETENPSLDDARRLQSDCAAVADGTVLGASYRVGYTGPTGEWVAGPADEHSALNVNRATPDQLLEVRPYMSEDVIAGIADWIDSDDEPLPLGGEIGLYQNMPRPYQPRNGFIRHTQELEMITSATALEVRGEDWNMNGVLDPNEDDGEESWPPDNADGLLDRGWAGSLSARSVGGGLTITGEEPLDLSEAMEGDLTKRLSIESDQAKAIMDYVAGNPQAQMRDFILNDLARLQQSVSATGERSRVAPLDDEQLGRLLDECVIGEPAPSGEPGKININSASAQTLEDLPELGSSSLADAILAERDSRPQGFTSLGQIKATPGLSRRDFASVYELLTVRSEAFTITSRGRDEQTGLEVEMVVGVDRRSLPLVITEMRVQ